MLKRKTKISEMFYALVSGKERSVGAGEMDDRACPMRDMSDSSKPRAW